MLRIKKIKSCLLFFSLLVITIIALILQNNYFDLLIITITLIVILKKAKFSYFSVFSFILWFSFLQEYFASVNTSLSSGRLRWDTRIPIYINELFLCTMCFFLLELFFFETTKILNDEKEIYKCSIGLNKVTATIFAVSALLLVFLAYPTIPSLSANLERDQGLLPSSLVVPIAVLLLAIIYDYIREKPFFKIVTLITIIWIMFHGDRVIVLGFVVYYMLKYMNDGKYHFETLKSIIFNKRTVLLVACLICIAAVSIRIQITREGSSYSLNVNQLLFSLLKQGTAADVVFNFNCATYMWKNGDGLNGYSYLHYLTNVLPKSDANTTPSVILMKKFDTLGGGLFFAEPMMNGGLILTFIHSLVFILLLYYIFKKKKQYHLIMAIPFIILIFRFCWYASLAGLVKMLLYYVPLIYLFSNKLKKIKVT